MSEQPLPYEFHITVNAEGRDVASFRGICQELGVKAIILDLGVNNGSTLTDYMTSSSDMFGCDQDAFDEMMRISDGLTATQHDVIRRKIETAPWHPAAPQQPGDHMPYGGYFESHLAIKIMPNDIPELRGQFMDDPVLANLHLSRNAFKQHEDGTVTIMTTLRHHEGSSAEFQTAVSEAAAAVGGLGRQLEKDPIVEYSLFDSNTNHDANWMTR